MGFERGSGIFRDFRGRLGCESFVSRFDRAVGVGV